jgi:L-ascorbate oxidase
MCSGCTHESLVVEPGKTYRLRLISSTVLVYTSVCFEGHNVTVIASDATPTDPLNMTCVDVNSGQRWVRAMMMKVTCHPLTFIM